MTDNTLPHINLEDKWCIYKTTHLSGFYYWGKGMTKLVVKGAYKGSGVKLYAAWELGGMPKGDWIATVQETFPSCLIPNDPKGRDQGEIDAYAREKQIITIDLMADPFCLNSVGGGKGGWKYGRILTKTSIDKRKASLKISMNLPEVKERHRQGILKANTLSHKAKLSTKMKETWEKRKSGELPALKPLKERINVSKVCKHCNKEFISSGNALFCCRDCREADKGKVKGPKPLKEKACLHCGTVFLGKTRKVYCDRACREAHQVMQGTRGLKKVRVGYGRGGWG